MSMLISRTIRDWDFWCIWTAKNSLQIRYSDVEWLTFWCNRCWCCKATEYCKAIETFIVKQWLIVAKQLMQLSSANWIFHENCNVYRSLKLNVSQKLNTALQLNAAHVNKTTIETVNRYSMMLSFVTIKRIEW